MRTIMARQTILAIILLAAWSVPAAWAQQAGSTVKPAKETATPPSTSTTASANESSDPSKKVVLKVGSAAITQSEIDFIYSNLNPQAKQALATQGRRPLGDEYVKVLLLSQQAENDHLDSVPGVRERLELQRTQMLAQAEYEKMSSEIKVSPDEIGQYFTAHQPDFQTAQVREFVIRKKPDGAKEGTPGLSAEEAKTKAESMRKALTSGTSIETVRKDSSVPNVVMIDSDPRTIHRGELLASLDKAAFELKDGQVSDPLETPQAVVFLQVVGHKMPEQKDVATEIENRLRQSKLETAVSDLRNKTKVWMDDEYFKPQVKNTTTTPEPPTTQPKPKP